MTTPLKGFDLQAHSLALNGLPAMRVDRYRGSRFGFLRRKILREREIARRKARP